MTFSSLAGHIVELAKLYEATTKPADHLVAEFLKPRSYIGSHDRRFITRSFYGMVRHRRRVQVLLRQYGSEQTNIPEEFSRTTLSQFVAYALAVEEFDPGEIIGRLQDRWQTALPEVRLDDITYWLARNKSLDFLQGDDIKQLCDWYSFEEWMVREWVEQFGQDEAEDLLHALNGEAPTTLRANTLKTSVERCRQRLKDEGVETTQTRIAPNGLVSARRFNAEASKAFKDGWFEVQDEGSQIVCLLAQPQPDSFVIDACAGAGGKALMMAEMMNNRGEILAVDVESGRLRELEKRARRNGATIIVPQRTGEIHPGDLLSKADVVLVDAPCSGVGTIRRNPAFKWSVTPALVERYARQQSEILDSNASYVKRGGKLVYATCSLMWQENENVVDKFLNEHPEFHPAPPSSSLTQTIIERLRETPYQKLLPHRHGTDGFFVAVLERKE